jgi:non-ribosomal peptide synthetase component F
MLTSWVFKSLLEQLHTVLVELCSAESIKSISDIEFIIRQDLETIWKWNNTVLIAIERCVHDMVAKRAHVSCELPAMCAWDGQLTYGELQNLSTELIWKLLDLALHPGCLVPLYFEKSVWTVVTLLAVCKAGCAFILLGQSQLEQRLHGIIEQVKPSVVLSSFACQSLSTRLFHNIIVIISDLIKELSTMPRGLLPQANPESTLNMVFTSRSTGKPQGTIISHSDLASAISYQMEQCNYGKDFRVFEFASYSFDMAVFVISFTLASGSCVYVSNEDDGKIDLAKSINDPRADTLVLTPSPSPSSKPQ